MKNEGKPKRSRKGEKHQKPLSLYGMSFDEAVGRLLAAKPEPKPKKPKK
jgi:hypothetical protein